MKVYKTQRRAMLAGILAPVVALVIGCGGGSGTGTGSVGTTGGITGTDNFPLTTGRTWTYSASFSGGTQTVTWTARGQTAFQGGTAYEIDFSNGAADFYNVTSSGVVDVGGTLSANGSVPASTTVNTPPEIGLPANTTVGYTWTQTFVRNASSIYQGQNSVLSMNVTTTGLIVGSETVTVPAGTFTNALHVRVTEASQTVGTTETDTSTSDAWYVSGVGIVKVVAADTTGGPSTEVLVSYTH